MSYLTISANSRLGPGATPENSSIPAPVGDLAWLGHELRTPMTALKGAIDLIAAGTLGPLPPGIAPLVAIVHRNSKRLADLLEDILKMNQLEADTASVALVPTHLSPLLQAVIADQSSLGNIAEEQIILHDQASNTWVAADPPLLRHMLIRLLGIALRTTHPDSIVTISLCRHGHLARLVIRHNSPAMAASATCPPAFDLGLTVARAIVASHAGTIVHTTDPDIGTAWTVDLPALAGS